MNWTAQGASDVGRSRTRNEDAYVVDAGLELAIVADGMGGHACGDEASRMAATVFRETVAEQRSVIEAYSRSSSPTDDAPVRRLLRDAMERSSRAVFAESQRDPSKKGMGTTCSALLVIGDRAFVAHVGDSRIYMIRDRRIVQITRDHNLLDHLVQKGEISRAEAGSPLLAKYRNALSRAVGVAAAVEVDTMALDALPGDTYLLCSDGLTRYVCEDELAELARHVPAERLETVLIDIANQRGGADNITVVSVRLSPARASDKQGASRVREDVAFLSESLLFGDLHAAEILHALTVARSVMMDVGAARPLPGVPDLPLFALVSGGGDLHRPDGSVTRIGPGEWFGAVSIVGLRDEPGPFVASEPTRLLRFDVSDLIEILAASPMISQRLVETLPSA